MKEETGHDEFESLLASLTPTTPDVSTASVLFEAGRQRGLGERAAFQESAYKKESTQKTRLRYWQLATAVSLLVTSVSLATQFQSSRNRALTQNSLEESEVASSEVEQAPGGGQDQEGEVRVSTEKMVPPRRAFDSRDRLARNDEKNESVLFRFPDWHPTVDPDSRLASRQRTLRHGVRGLPEPSNRVRVLVDNSTRDRRTLIDELLAEGL